MINLNDDTDLSGIDTAAEAVNNFIGKGTAFVLLFLMMGASTAIIIALTAPFAVAAVLDLFQVHKYFTPEALVAEPVNRIFAVFMGFAFTALVMLKHTTFAGVEESDL